jgi:fucose 4-O-acetylase-like acetyltransferase
MILVGINMVIEWNSYLLELLGRMSLYVYVSHMGIWPSMELIAAKYAPVVLGNVSLRFIASCILTFIISYLCLLCETNIQKIRKCRKIDCPR